MDSKRVVKKTGNQMVVGAKKYFDAETGEVQEFTVVEKSINTDINFHKIWLQDILHVLDSFGNKKISILTFLLGKMRTEDNSISVTYTYIVEQTGISYQTVATTMRELLDANVIQNIRTGLYMFNPDLIIKGKPGKRQRLLIEYNFTDDNSITEKKKQQETQKIAEKLATYQDKSPNLFQPAKFKTDENGTQSIWDEKEKVWRVEI